MSDHAGVVVVIPTVSARAELLAETIARWRVFGVDPLIVPTPRAWTPSPITHGRIGRLALAAALTTAPAAVLFCEDDVALSPRLGVYLSAMAHWPDVTTLYLPGERHYGAAARRWLAGGGDPCPVTRLPVVSPSNWFGSQAILLPVWFARRVVIAPEPPKLIDAGLDMVIRRVLAATGQRLYATIPNLVQHLAPPSVTSARYKPHRSTTFDRS